MSEFLWKDDDIICGHENKEKYREIWLNLEVVNALALDECEQAGFPDDWNKQWILNYKKRRREFNK